MSKVYMIFLFLLSVTVQLSHTQEPLPQFYGTIYTFQDEKVFDVLHFNEDEPSMTTVFSTEIISDENGLTNTKQSIYNIDSTKYGACYLTFVSLILNKDEGFLVSIQISGVGACQSNQKIIRWHIKPEQTVDGIHSYDFVFVRDLEQVINEDNLNQISPTHVIGHKLL